MQEYIVKNRLWLVPAIGGLLAASMPVLLQLIGGSVIGTLPGWFPFVPLSFGGVGAIAGAMVTDTVSASLVRLFGSALVFAVIVHMAFR